MALVQSSLSLTEKEILKSISEHELIGFICDKNPQKAQEKFKNLIKYCTITSGIKLMPDEIIEANLFNLITSFYKNYTFEEISKAIYMHSIGELETRHEHYGLFDTIFLSKVMTDWLILKTRTRQRIASLLPPVTIKEPTPEDLYQGLLNYLNTKKQFPDIWAWSKVYAHMDECLMISESNDEKRVVWDEVSARENEKMELELLSVADYIERQKLTESLNERITVECRKVLIIRHLQHLIK